jgi:NAD(P)-dependent dehydrogenase (short-subunit alcohol dehydrogenase family)
MSNSAKIALVTGGSRGLGKDMALRLAETGKDVILTYHTQQAEAEAVVAEIQKMGRKAVALQLNVALISGFDAFITQVQSALKQTFGTEKFDYLVNNAGVGATLPFGTVTEEDFDHLFNVHFKGVFFLTQKSLPLLADGGGIVNISTGTTRFCIPGYSVYASAKGAIETFTRYLAKELGSRGITANVLAPGAIETDFNGAAIRNNPQLKGYLGSITALGRVGEATDIGGVVAALCSDACRWVNGQRIEASGGMML